MFPLQTGKDVLFQLKMNLAIEAGCYTFNAKLAHPLEGGNRPEFFIDETPWLGPLQVTWNYNLEAPPFHGLVGLPSEAQFVTEMDSLV